MWCPLRGTSVRGAAHLLSLKQASRASAPLRTLHWRVLRSFARCRTRATGTCSTSYRPCTPCHPVRMRPVSPVLVALLAAVLLAGRFGAGYGTGGRRERTREAPPRREPSRET